MPCSSTFVANEGHRVQPSTSQLVCGGSEDYSPRIWVVVLKLGLPVQDPTQGCDEAGGPPLGHGILGYVTEIAFCRVEGSDVIHQACPLA